MSARIDNTLFMPSTGHIVPKGMRTHAWQVSSKEFRELQRILNFDYYKWDLFLGGTCRILPESIVLSRSVHAYLVSVTEAFAGLMRRFEATARSDPYIHAALGIEPTLSRMVSSRVNDELSFGRADFFMTPDGRWVLSEFNEDAPGGFNEAVGIPASLSESQLGGTCAGDLKNAMCAAFDDCDRIGLSFATAFSEDLQHCAVLEKWLRERGHHTLLSGPDQLRRRWRGVSLAKARIDGMFRFYPGEWLGLLDNVADWETLPGSFRLMNPPVRLLSQSKKSFGLWRSGEGVDAADMMLAKRHCPATSDFDIAQLDQYRERQSDLVLKRAFGRMGDAVVIGALVSAGDWSRALEFAAARPGEIAVQQRFEVQPLAFASGLMYPTIGVYTVNGRFAGYYSRVAHSPFITHEAFHVTTVIEAA